MKNNLFRRALQGIEPRLRTFFGQMTPKRRMAVVITTLALFGLGCIWMTASGVYQFGKQRAMRLHIERVAQPDFSTGPVQDTIQPLNDLGDGAAE